MIVHDCPACYGGDHSKHVQSWGTRPEGIIDGDVCMCTGDCNERAQERFEKLMGGQFFNPDAGSTRPTATEVLRMLEKIDVITTHAESKDRCCGIERDKYGRCRHRTYHPIYVEYDSHDSRSSQYGS